METNSTTDGDGRFCFAIDRGGTFTDVWARCPDGSIRVLKLLSEDPQNYPDAPTEAIRRLLENETGQPHPRGQSVDASRIGWIRMGTTVATNALLERKGERMALLVTEGFRDVLQIGNQARPNIFDLKIEMPELLYERVIEVEERVIMTNDDMECEYPVLDDPENRRKKGVTGDVYILKPLNEARLREDLQRLTYDNVNPIKSLAIVFAHSYAYPEHEKLCKKIALECGFTEISVSHEVMQMMRMVPRGHTVAVDAYLTPCVKKYVENFRKGFKNNLEGINVLFMRSDGGLTPMDRFAGSNAIISGPAGGYVGYSMCLGGGENCSENGDGDQNSNFMPILGYDMGGTSTDVSRFDGHFEHVFEAELAGVTIQTPQLDIRTVAAGGGSKLHFRSGIFHVGPDSAGANPGPACYKKGGPLTVTDANLLLGRLRKEYFPSIFGPKANEPLDEAATRAAFETLRAEINGYLKQSGGKDVVGSNSEAATTTRVAEMSVEDIALGFIQVANEAMARPIRSLTQGRGLDSSKHILACFGGAGGQHACQVARALNIGKVRIHRYSSVLSAVGMAMADVVHDVSEPFNKTYSADNIEYIDARIEQLRKQCEQKLREQGFTQKDAVKTEAYLNLRYDRTDCAFMCVSTSLKFDAEQRKSDFASKFGDFQRVFEAQYKREFSFTLPDRPIIVDDIRVRGIGKALTSQTHTKNKSLSKSAENAPEPNKTCKVFFKQTGWTETNLYKLEELRENFTLHGPCIILDQNSTILIEPDCEAKIINERDLLEIRVPQFEKISEINLDDNSEGDPIQLAIFSHRFMSIAEEMGKVLRRTAISTNIKERLDFSCALFSDDGGLVSNAPHIPVHLGAMQETVRHLICRIEKKEVDAPKSGDVYLSNHPKAGGSHLPDLTVITPVFNTDDDKNYDSPAAQSNSTGKICNDGDAGQKKTSKSRDEKSMSSRNLGKNCNSKPIFWTANRGHHADIGGSRPGSMPPDSKTIDVEGAVFDCFHLVRDGEFQEAAVTDELNAPGKVPGCSPTRALADNLADLHAQVAANQKGIGLVTDLIRIYGLRVVQAYMKLIQKNAERAVRDALIKIAADRQKELGTSDADEKLSLKYEDFMDDGSVLRLRVEIDKKSGSAVFDFGGTTPQVYGNTNCPQAVTKSALIYCLRSLVPYDIPLNQGCLAPVEVIIPAGSLLDPDEQAAVVGGNVLTSQRVCDVILGAFGVCAASQGCMNNITFGDDSFSYYETVAGGAGAGPTWHGRSGVHTHMTNTRITDVEIIESRYPILVDRFVLNPGTGGAGEHRGGDGVVRELVFRRPLELSVLTERRVFQPYGLQGARGGACGANLMLRRRGKKAGEKGHDDSRLLNLGGKNSITTQAGDKFILMTPGGGGFGAPPQ